VTKARTPPVWLVLVPALVLAAVGVRAVTAEMRASEDAARERARSVASRLARSVDALVAEYAGPLPKAGAALTREQAKEVTAHLQPRRALTIDGVSLSLDHDLPPDPGPVPAKEASLVDDALARAKRLAREPNGNIAAAALESATAEVVTHPVAKARLLFASLEHDGGAVGDAAPADRVRRAAAVGAYLRDADGTPFDVRALHLLTTALGPGRFLDADLLRLYRRVAEDPWGLDDSERNRVLDDAEGARSRLLWTSVPPDDPWDHWWNCRSGWDAAREIARGLARSGNAPSATTLGALRISVWTDVVVDDRRALLGGDIPPLAATLRLDPELTALASEPRVLAVHLVSTDGRHAFEKQAPEPSQREFISEAASLAEPLSAWRAEAIVAPESGVPATAWLLGGALVLTTAALLAGTLALRRAAERSARLAEDRQTFLDHVAHELRTPAAAVQALTEELASGHVTKEREPQYREHLLRESRRLSALVEDTLDLTRLDAGRLAFRMEPADLRDVVRRAIEESQGAGRVVATLPDAPVVRPVDEGTLRRAVRNLVENAVRHGGGTAQVTVALEASNGAASVVVADKGRGIAAEHLPRLFERFYRVPSATHEVKGVGLGLALCREVARAHGGDVTAESRVGEGSTFTLRIPLA
jgi:signal transduction histidine kinase